MVVKELSHFYKGRVGDIHIPMPIKANPQGTRGHAQETPFPQTTSRILWPSTD